jgi:hypothetical protein
MIYLFPQKKLCVYLDKKMLWASFWVIFSRTHLVTLFLTYPSIPAKYLQGLFSHTVLLTISANRLNYLLPLLSRITRYRSRKMVRPFRQAPDHQSEDGTLISSCVVCG